MVLTQEADENRVAEDTLLVVGGLLAEPVMHDGGYQMQIANRLTDDRPQQSRDRCAVCLVAGWDHDFKTHADSAVNPHGDIQFSVDTYSAVRQR